MRFTEEQLKKAKSAKSAEELLAVAKESGVELTEDEAKKYFSELHKEGELSDDELDNVAGGGDGKLRRDVGTERFNIGDIVVDNAGVQYEIIAHDCDEYDGITLTYVWFLATVKYVPESAKAFTGLREGDTHYVHSAIVSKI